jgi:hypothetical protein
MTKMKTNTAVLVALSATLLAVSACQRAVTLDTRTFALKHLNANAAEQIVRPYVYEDRADGPHGMMSASAGALTVRETPDNLDKIQRVLQQYDVPRSDARLHFQLVEADHFTGTDPAIAPVEAQLKKIFQFKGYRLIGEAVVGAADGSKVSQRLPGGYSVRAQIYRTDPGTIRVQEIQLWAPGAGPVLQTTVNIHPGQTLVVGNAAEGGKSTATLLLVLRADEVAEATK